MPPVPPPSWKTPCNVSGLRESQRGFTLIEMLIVVAIIGLLAGVMAPIFGESTEEARVAAAKAQMDSFGSALERYRLHNRKFPDKLQGLIESTGTTWNGPYIRDSNGIPKDPWDVEYVYAPVDSGKRFQLKSTGSGEDIVY